MRKIIPLIVLFIAAIISTYQISQEKTVKNPLSSTSNDMLNLEDQWAQGNVVSLIRHTERCDRSDNPCLDGTDGITTLGKAEAIKIGKAYEKLPKQDLVIYNSPQKRAQQSANFMFPGKSVDTMLLGNSCKENLLDDIVKYKEYAKNMILVTHSTCIELLGIQQGDKLVKMDIHGTETYGASFFLTINKEKDNARFLGYLSADDWGKIYK